MTPPRKSTALLVLIALATGALYLRTLTFDFVSYDDPVYVTNNPHVRAGLTWDGVVYAFTAGETGTWQPLALLSHMLDCALFGPNAAGHHATSAMLHAINTLFLGLALVRMTGAAGPSLFAAAVFGLHPLHVESVAWISERKDVLSTLFFLIALDTYARWAQSLHKTWLALSTLALALGLMVKPMLVTLPFVLLLLDYWPLHRTRVENKLRCFASLAAEKLPMIALALASSVATIAVQRGAQATSSLDALPLGMRLANAALGYVRYIGKTLWPADLLVYYPYPLHDLTAVRIGAALCVLAAISAIAWRLRNRAPYVVVGWLWYLGTLAPVIGIIQVGTQSIADRYTYIPMIGLLIMSAWGIHDLVSTERWVTARRAIGAVSCVLVVVLAALTWSRMGIWRDSETLYRSTLQTMPDNAFANMGLGQLLVDRKQYADAVPRLETAIHKRHREPEAHYHLGIALQALGQLPKAEEHYRAAVALDPANSLMWNNFGVTLDAMGRPADALAAFERASALGPRNQEAAGNLVRYLARMGRIDDALREASAAAARMPESGDIQSLLATLHAMRTAPPTPAP